MPEMSPRWLVDNTHVRFGSKADVAVERGALSSTRSIRRIREVEQRNLHFVIARALKEHLSN
jgi:hypothetical protein